jgi:hypothetical protein
MRFDPPGRQEIPLAFRARNLQGQAKEGIFDAAQG